MSIYLLNYIFLSFLLINIRVIAKTYSEKIIVLPFSSFGGIIFDLSSPFSFASMCFQSPITSLDTEKKEFITSKTKETISINSQDYTFEQCSGNVNIKTVNLSLTFYRADTRKSAGSPEYLWCYNQITFAYKPASISTSLVHQLYSSNQIDKMIFGIHFYEKFEDKGDIYIGGIPLELTKNKPYAKCKVLNDAWSCIMDKISLLDNNKKVVFEFPFENKKVIFSTEVPNIIVPKKDFEWFINNVFDSVIKSKICDIQNYSIICYKDTQFFFDYLPDILNFKVGDYSFGIFFRNLFKDAHFVISQRFQEKDNSDEWVLGYSFLECFLSVYDYDNQFIMLYSENNDKAFITIGKQFQSFTILFCLIIVVLLIGIIQMVITNKKDAEIFLLR